MFAPLGFDAQMMREIQRKADEQEAVLRIMTLFPDGQYNAHPTYEQFTSFVYEAASQGYTLDSLYRMFASGHLDNAIDALLRKHAQGWPPAGKTVEGMAETPLLHSGKRVEHG